MGKCFGKFKFNRDEKASKLPTQLYEKRLVDVPSLKGKVVAITGCTTGTGFVLACTAARKDASVILMLNRPSERAAVAEAKVKDAAAAAGTKTAVHTIDCDVQDLASVRACAPNIIKLTAKHGGLDVLCNNAGVMALPDVRTKDSYDIQMQTNQLSHVLLLGLLMPELERAAATRGEARVVFHSSKSRDMPREKLAQRYFSVSEPGTLGGEHGLFLELCGIVGGPSHRYHQTKLANACYTMALHDELMKRNSKIKALSCEPGYAITELQRTSMNHGGMPHWIANLVKAQSQEDGTVPLMTCCFMENVDSGDFFAPEKGLVGDAKKLISKGQAVKKGDEKNVLDQGNKTVAWVESNKILQGSPLFGN